MNDIVIDKSKLINMQEDIQACINLLNRTTTGNLVHKRGNCLCILGMLDKKLDKFIKNE